MYKEALSYEQTPERTAEIMTYEAASVMRNLIYKKHFGQTGYGMGKR
jgi:hypothetical protein